MQVISLSQNKFKQLTKLNLPKEVFNTEGTIYDYRYKGEDKVFKTLYNDIGDNLANKLYTLEVLDYNRKYLPDNLCIPDNLVIVGGLVKGFTMPKIDGINLTMILKDKSIDKKEQIFYLKKVGELLRQLEQIRNYTPFKTFFLNDIHDSNFIVNPNKKSVTAIDLDSSKVKNNIVFPARFLVNRALLNNVNDKYKLAEENQSGYIKADQNTDIYCYIIMILNYLYGENINNVSIEDFYLYLNYLEDIGISEKLILYFSRIVINKENKNPFELLDSLDETKIARARKIVFKANTK